MLPVYDPTKSALYLREALKRSLGFGTCHIITNDEQRAMSAQRQAQHAQPYDAEWAVLPYGYDPIMGFSQPESSAQYSQSGIYGDTGMCTPSQSNTITGRG